MGTPHAARAGCFDCAPADVRVSISHPRREGTQSTGKINDEVRPQGVPRALANGHRAIRGKEASHSKPMFERAIVSAFDRHPIKPVGVVQPAADHVRRVEREGSKHASVDALTSEYIQQIRGNRFAASVERLIGTRSRRIGERLGVCGKADIRARRGDECWRIDREPLDEC